MVDVKSGLGLSKLGDALSLGKLFSPLTDVVGKARDAEPRWEAPHSWAAADGLYANDTEAWIYRQLPHAAVEDGSTTIDDLLNDLLTLGAGREVHLLAHTWDGPTGSPAGTPERLASFQDESLRFPAPVRALFIGVRLRAKPKPALKGRGALVGQVIESVDALLGEAVPDFGIYDDDRAAVTQVLDAHNALPAGRREGVQLESWYMLGISGDTRATEYDDYIAFEGADRMELVAVTSVAPTAAIAALPPAGWRGATVASARGELNSISDGGTVGGGLMRASVILGRRSAEAQLDWPTQLRDLTGVVIRPLPLRQLAALHETMPCSPKRLSATLQNVRGGLLARVGFCDPHVQNASGGLLVGMTGAHLTQPLFLKPVPERPLTLLVGGPRSGKTAQSEMLATQAALGDMRVLYVTGSRTAGEGTLDLVGGSTWVPAQPGDLDPFRFAPVPDALELLQALVAALHLPLSAAEQDDLAAGFRRAQATGTAGLPRVLELAGGVTAVAQLRRALSKDPQLQVFAGGAEIPHANLPHVSRVSLENFTDGRARDLALAVLLTHALAASRPTLVVVDDLDDALQGAATRAVLGRIATTAAPNTHVVLTAGAADLLAPLAPFAGMTVVLAHDMERAAEGLKLAGADVTESRIEWLSSARAQIVDGLIERPPLALLRTEGRPISVLLGPWPTAAVSTLTRGEAVGYAADQ